MSLLKMYAPQLFVSADGRLFVQITLGGVTVMRPTPDDIKSYSPEQVREYFNAIVPVMIVELQKIRRHKIKKLNRKVGNEDQKRRQYASARDPGADE